MKPFVFMALACLPLVVWTQDKTVSKAPKSSAKLAKDSNFVLDTVNLQGDDFYSPFIWGQDYGEWDSTSIKEQIQKRDFAHEEFFMRNIDREEFEEERALLQFIGQEGDGSLRRKKSVWTPFPEQGKIAPTSDVAPSAPAPTSPNSKPSKP